MVFNFMIAAIVAVVVVVILAAYNNAIIICRKELKKRHHLKRKRNERMRNFARKVATLLVLNSFSQSARAFIFLCSTVEHIREISRRAKSFINSRQKCFVHLFGPQ